MLVHMTSSPKANPPQQLTLLNWAESKRAFPVGFGRSALFRVGDKRDPRQTFKKAVIATVDNSVLTYTGEELRIDDEDLLLQLLHLAKGQESTKNGFEVRFSASSMLGVLKWGNGAAAHERLRLCIERLQVGSIFYKRGNDSLSQEFYGSFINEASHQQLSRLSEWVVLLNRKSAQLLMPRAELDWPTRVSLRSDLSRWLQTYIECESLGEYQDHPLEELMRLSGSKAKEITNFKTSLKRALDELALNKAIMSYTFMTPRLVRIFVNIEEDVMDT